MRLTVGTRGSKLSLIQTNVIIKRLKRQYPDLKVDVKVIRTTGDRITEKPLTAIKVKGIFEREIDKAVINGEVDFAVHSMKDLPVEQPPEIMIVAVPERDEPNDVLISKDKRRFMDLPRGAVIGTGSPRRIAQILRLRPDLRVKPIRGNVDTRIRKVENGLYDAVILAEAGVKRLGIQNYISERLSLEDFTPAPGQGALAIVAMKKNREIVEILKGLNHQPSMAATFAERAFIKKIGGGCRVPLGAIAQTKNDTLTLHTCILSRDGRIKIQAVVEGNTDFPENLGYKAASEIMRRCPRELIDSWRG